MMNEGKISVIVPVYKVEQYLGRCVKSIVHQTYKNLEIILVDDGSPDQCPAMCDQYAKQDKRVKSLHKTNGGLSEARNYGLRNATGEYILYVDSDDYIELESCERLISSADENVDVVCGAYREISENGIIEKRHSNLQENVCYSAKEYVTASVQRNEWYAPAWLNLYRKSFLIENDLYYKVGTYYEDIEMLPRLFLSNPKVKYIDFAFYNYIIRDNSIMTSAVTEQKKQMVIEIYSHWMDLCSKVEDETYRAYLYGILIKYYMASARQMGITGWKIAGLDFRFARKYALNTKETVKTVLFNFFPKQYLKLTNM